MDAFPNPSKEQLVDVVQRHFMSQVLAKLVSAPLHSVLCVRVRVHVFVGIAFIFLNNE